MRNIMLFASVAALALSAEAHALTYSEVIPAMGPASLPGPAGGGVSIPIRFQVIDKGGLVDEISVEYAQNWGCLGADNNINNADNYPVVSVYDAGSIYRYNANGSRTIHDYDIDVRGATRIATLNVARPDDYDQGCPAEGGSCANHHAELIPQDWQTLVHSGDLLVWAVDRNGSNCMGAYYYNNQLGLPYPGGNTGARYPATAGGELTIGVHVYEGDGCVPGACSSWPGPSHY